MNEIVLYSHLALGLALLAALATGKIRAWRGASMATALLLALTGAFNFMTRMSGAPKGWHAGMGIKVLLALHVIGMVFLITRSGADAVKAARWRKGALVSCVLVVLIGLYFSNMAR
ncbi:MAG: hypothetical protein HY858_09820 [Candidatus Solibacter usitatus]|nr:hypothetical protein [Candidatus Solibacter usitatus]